MKNVIKVLITIISLISLLSVSIFAVNTDNIVHTHEVTVEFRNSNLSSFEQARIIEYIEAGEQMAMAGNVLCTLFGHSMGATEIITATSHCVYDSAPRCRVDTYGISACTRCDYITSSLLSYSSKSCCP